MIHKSLPNGFPWYEVDYTDHLPFNYSHQNHFRPAGGISHAHCLIAPANGILPFMLRKSQTSEYIEKFYLKCGVTGDIVLDLENWIPLMTITHGSYEGYDYWWFDDSYNSQPYAYMYGWDNTTQQYGYIPQYLELQSGFYFLEMHFQSSMCYSETFHVPDKRFRWNEMKNCDYTKLTWGNDDDDIRPLKFYPGFYYVAYLLGDVNLMEPEYEREVLENTLEEETPIFEKMRMVWRLQTVVPEYLRRGLGIIPMCKEIYIQRPNDKGGGKVKNFTFSSTTEAGGAMAAIDIRFEELVVTTSKNCGINTMDNSPCPAMPSNVYFNTLKPAGGYKFFAIIPPQCTAKMYGGYSNLGPFTLIGTGLGAVISASELLVGKYVAWSPSNYTWIKMVVSTFTCTVGETAPTHTIP